MNCEFEDWAPRNSREIQTEFAKLGLLAEALRAGIANAVNKRVVSLLQFNDESTGLIVRWYNWASSLKRDEVLAGELELLAGILGRISAGKTKDANSTAEQLERFRKTLEPKMLALIPASKPDSSRCIEVPGMQTLSGVAAEIRSCIQDVRFGAIELGKLMPRIIRENRFREPVRSEGPGFTPDENELSENEKRQFELNVQTYKKKAIVNAKRPPEEQTIIPNPSGDWKARRGGWPKLLDDAAWTLEVFWKGNDRARVLFGDLSIAEQKILNDCRPSWCAMLVGLLNAITDPFYGTKTKHPDTGSLGLRLSVLPNINLQEDWETQVDELLGFDNDLRKLVVADSLDSGGGFHAPTDWESVDSLVTLAKKQYTKIKCALDQEKREIAASLIEDDGNSDEGSLLGSQADSICDNCKKTWCDSIEYVLEKVSPRVAGKIRTVDKWHKEILCRQFTNEGLYFEALEQLRPQVVCDLKHSAGSGIKNSNVPNCGKNGQPSSVNGGRRVALQKSIEEIEADTPKLAPESVEWIRAHKKNQEKFSLAIRSLKDYRLVSSGGRKMPDGMFGVDKDGRRWRRKGTPNSAVYYFVADLEKASMKSVDSTL